tara:strand:- start:279 stop:482 length:204 start_codon:yes stop_codon:yes gene_type:complete
MIPFTYKGYKVSINYIANVTKVTATNGVDDCSWLFNVDTPHQAKWLVFVKRVKRTINDRLRYLQQHK